MHALIGSARIRSNRGGFDSGIDADLTAQHPRGKKDVYFFASSQYDMHHITVMRYSAQHKAQTHERLVKTAAKQFRRRGLQGIGIAKLMGGMGLTHGGFYAHFDNKNELVAAAARAIFSEAITAIESAAAAAPKGHELAAIIGSYLSAGHRDTTEGCLLPSLAGEMARQPRGVRKALTQAFAEYANTVAKYMPGPSDAERGSQAQLLFSGMAGTMMVARAVIDPQLSDALLAQGREFYMSAFSAL